jgi:hypothetical protein
MGFRHLLTDDVVISHHLGTEMDSEGEGNQIWGPLVPIKAAVERAFVKVVDGNGQEKISSIQVAFDGNAHAFGPTDRMWVLPEDDPTCDPARSPLSVRSAASRRRRLRLRQAFL